VSEMMIRRNPDVILTELGDGTGVLLHLGTKFYYALNPTGVAAWKALEGGATTARLAQCIAAQYRVAFQEAERDLAPVMSEMLTEGLVHRSPT
jgi:hypothetical protein